MSNKKNVITVSRAVDSRLETREGWVSAQTYASHSGDDLLRAELVNENSRLIMRRSQDNGRTWVEAETIGQREFCGPGKVLDPSLDAFYLDPDNGRLVRFVSDFIDVDRRGKENEYIELWADAVGMGPRTRREFYQISRDGGHHWEPRQQIIEKGAEYSAEHWGRDLWYGKSSLCMEGRHVQKLPDGTIVIPFYLWPTDEYIQNVFREENWPRELCDDAKYFMESRCLLGHWRKDLGGFDWESGGSIRLPGGYTSAGTCGTDEPTIAFLDDGRWFAVLRTSTSHVAEFRAKNIPLLRQGAVSKDNGRSWHGRVLTFEDGSPVYSPSAFSEFIRSSKNGKWYWIGNILDKPTYGGCDPRHPFQIVELDQRSLNLKRETVTVIEDISPGDPDTVRFSNFRVYEERGTKDFVLLMTKCSSELTPGYPNLPFPHYRYRISLPD